MNKEEIINEYAKNIRLVYDSNLGKAIGYPITDKYNVSLVANCAAVLTILNFIKEN